MAQALPQQMHAIETSAAGGPDVLRLATRPVPKPAASEVLIKVAAAGVNGPDMMQRKGLYPPPPGATDLLGLEVSGEIVAVGDNVTSPVFQRVTLSPTGAATPSIARSTRYTVCRCRKACR